MPLDLSNKVPDLCAALDVLEAERVVGAIRLGPQNEGICTSGSRVRTKCSYSSTEDAWQTLLSLIDVQAADGMLQEDLVRVALCLCDDFGLLSVLVKVASAEGGASVLPLEVYELIYLWNEVG